MDVAGIQGVLGLASACQNLLFACGTYEATSRLVLETAGSHPDIVRPFVGVHPSEVRPGTGLGWLEECLKSAAGLGEVGLDPRYSPAGPRSAQMDAFTAQLEQAVSLGKPVQVHSRDAETECLDVLGGFSPKGVLMHWFQKEEKLDVVLERGYFVSFGPSLIYSKKAQRMAAKAGPDRSLVETDSPVPYAPLGGVFGPSLVPSVAFKLADAWGMGFEDAVMALSRSAMRYLGASEKG